ANRAGAEAHPARPRSGLAATMVGATREVNATFHLSTTAMPRDELERRRDAVLAAMHQQGIDQAIFTTPANVYYLTGIQLGGFTTPQALILDASGAHVFVYRLIEYFWYEHWAPMTWCDQWRPY